MQSDDINIVMCRKQTNEISAAERGLAGELTDLDDDILEPDLSAPAAVAMSDTTLGVTAMRSEPAQKVYMEKSSN